MSMRAYFAPFVPFGQFLYFCQEIDHSPVFPATKSGLFLWKIHEKSIGDSLHSRKWAGKHNLPHLSPFDLFYILLSGNRSLAGISSNSKLKLPANDRFHDISTKTDREGQMGQNKPSCSFPRMETIAIRFLMNFYLIKVNFELLEIPASDPCPDKSKKNGSNGVKWGKISLPAYFREWRLSPIDFSWFFT